MALSLEDELWSTSCSSSCWRTGDWSRRRSSCCSAAKGRKRRSQEEDRESELLERDLDLLRGRGVEDLEQEEWPRQLRDIRLVRGDVRRPQGDRRANEVGERRLGDSDTSLAGLLVMPGGGWTTREGGTCPRLATWSRGTAVVKVSRRRQGTMALGTRAAPTDVRRTLASLWATAHGSQPFGRRWKAVRRWWKTVRSSAWPPVSTGQRLITTRAPGPGATVRLLWLWLMRSPWWCSVTRGARRMQRLRAHIGRRNSGTHRRLAWSNTQKIHHLVLHGRKQSVLHVLHPSLNVWQCRRWHWKDLGGRGSNLRWWRNSSKHCDCWHCGEGHWRSSQKVRLEQQGCRSCSRSCRFQEKGALHPWKNRAKRVGGEWCFWLKVLASSEQGEVHEV